MYDLADLHKSTLGLDVAFACHNEPLPDRAVRTMINNEMRKRRTLETMVTNLYQILAIASPIAEVLYLDTLELHDPDGNVPARINWALDQ